MTSAVGWDLAPEVARWTPLPALERTVTADACVIGLGGSGLAAVDELLGRGLTVVGLDAGRIGGGAAGRNGGFLLGGGALALHEAQRQWGSDVANDLYWATLRELDRLDAELGPAVIRRVGSIRLAGLPGDPADDAEAEDRLRECFDCDAQLVALRAAGIGVESYVGELGHGIFLPDDAAMNPARRALAMAAELGHWARLYEHSPVVSIEPGRVVTSAGSVAAATIVVAVDGRLDVLLPVLAPFVRTARLQMTATEPVAPGRLPCPVYGRWGYDYAQQDPSGRLYVGGGRDRFAAEEWTTGTSPTAGVQDWIASVAARMAGEPVQITHRWAASVGYTEDGRALCGRVDDGVVACGGYSGTGNLVGAVAARAAVALALDDTTPPSYFRSDLV